MISNTMLWQLSKDFKRKAMTLLEWPSESTDINAIENLCKEVKIRVHRKGPQYLQNPKTFVWKNGPKSRLSNACNSVQEES